MTTLEERQPPRWMVAQGVPETALAVTGSGGTRFVDIDSRTVWGVRPDGRLQKTVWREPSAPTPVAPVTMTTEEAVRSLAQRPRSESYEEFCSRQQALGLAVQLGMVNPPAPKAPPGPDRPSTDHPAFGRYMRALSEFTNAPERVEERERSQKVAHEAGREIREVLQRRAAGNGPVAQRAQRELGAIEQRERERGRRL